MRSEPGKERNCSPRSSLQVSAPCCCYTRVRRLDWEMRLLTVSSCSGQSLVSPGVDQPRPLLLCVQSSTTIYNYIRISTHICTGGPGAGADSGDPRGDEALSDGRWSKEWIALRGLTQDVIYWVGIDNCTYYEPLYCRVFYKVSFTKHRSL